jgi:membrane protein YdbS with pleckstrin-like domain
MEGHRKLIDGGILVFKTKPTIIVSVILLFPSIVMWYILYRVHAHFNEQYVTIGCVIFGLIILRGSMRSVANVFSSLFMNYYLTSKAIVIKRGGLSSSQISIPLSEVMGIETSGNILWSIFGYSNLIIHTFNGGPIALIYTKKGKKFREKLRELTGK